MASAALELLKKGGAKKPTLDETLKEPAKVEVAEDAGEESFEEIQEQDIEGSGLVVEEDEPANDEPAAEEVVTPTTAAQVHKLSDQGTVAVAGKLGLDVELAVSDLKAAITKELFGGKTGKKTGTVLKKAAQSGEVLGPDPLYTLSEEIEKLSNQDEIEARIRKVQETEGLSDFHMGGLFARLKDVGDWGEYKNFSDYVAANFGVDYRKAQYQITIYTGLVGLGIPYEKVSKAGWTKLKELIKVLTPDNVDDWVAKAMAVNTDTLIKMIKAEESDGSSSETSGSGDTTSEIKSKAFKLHPDQLETINQALAKCKETTGTESDAVALFDICIEYMGNSTGKKAAPKAKPLTPKQFLKSILDKHDGNPENALEELFGEESGFDGMFEGYVVAPADSITQG